MTNKLFKELKQEDCRHEEQLHQNFINQKLKNNENN